MFALDSSALGESVRKAVVAGHFYPANPAKLLAEVDAYLSGGKVLSSSPPLLISPHAGYAFSGALAGRAFATIDRTVHTLIIVGPSHHHYFEGVSIPDVDAFETPLGRVSLDKKRIAAFRKNPIVKNAPEAHQKEHSIEVQLPFAQKLLPKFKIVPIVTGKVDPKAVAELLFPHCGPGVLVVASSDLSHYHSHEEALAIDQRSLKTIVDQDIDGFFDGCGEVGVRAVLILSRRMGLSPVILDSKNSFETAPAQYKTADRVVGYAAVAFSKRVHQNDSEDLSPEAKQYLLTLARKSLESAVRGEGLPGPDSLPPYAMELTGCFVTLKKSGELRGCIGYIEPIKQLHEAVVDNARNAALRDNRFKPVSPEELKDITIELSVLTRPRPVPYTGTADLLAKLTPNVDGVILSQGHRQSTFLPQVWEQIPDKVQFLEQLSLKGGMSRDGWKKAEVKTYRAIHFHE